jgi:hypothetical protein
MTEQWVLCLLRCMQTRLRVDCVEGHPIRVGYKQEESLSIFILLLLLELLPNA